MLDAKNHEQNEDLRRIRFWKEAWEDNRSFWHKEKVHDDLNDFFDKLFPNINHTSYKKSILFPLCGKTIDMAWCFKDKGLNVYGIEVVDQAIKEFFKDHKFYPITNIKIDDKTEKFSFTKDNGELTIFKTDMFNSSDLVESGIVKPVDAIFDRGSMTAIQPDLRESYINTLLMWLKPGGKILLNCPFYDQNLVSGPPHSVPEDQIKSLYGKYGCHVDKIKIIKGIIHEKAEADYNLFIITKPSK